jgi:hypothetical protein
MIRSFRTTTLLLLLLCSGAWAQVRQTLPLTAPQQREVRKLVRTDPEVQVLWQLVKGN